MWRTSLWGALLVVLTVVAYAPVRNAGYIWDDDAYVTKNRALRDAGGLRRIWTEPRASPQYYPLVFTSFWLEHRAWELRPLGYHLDNVLLHALAAVLLWRVLARLRVPGAWLAAAVFALHPVQVESVAWITERKNVLSTVFYLAAALTYLQFDAQRRWGFYFLALVFFVAALLSKSVTCSLPAALLLVLWWKGRRLDARVILPLIPMFVLGLAAGLFTVYLERRHVGAVGAEWNFSLLDRVLIAGRAICFYVRNLLFPANLTFIYPRWPIDAHQWWQYLFPCGVLLALAALWLTRHRIGRGPFVGALFFAGTLFPALGFVNVYPMRYSFVADHFQYLASIGVIALIAACAVTAFQRVNARLAGVIATVVVLTMLFAATFVRARVYHDEETLWRDTLARNPQAWMAANNLAIILDYRGEPREALDYYRRALEVHPDWEAHFNMASFLARNDELDQARRHFESAVAAAGDNPAALDDLAKQALGIGNKLSGAGQLRQAEVLYEHSLHLRPDQLESMNNLAWVLSVQSDVTPRGKARAIELAEKAVEQTSKQQAAIIDTLAAAYANAGRFTDAVAMAELAVSLATNDGPTALSEVLRDHLHSFQSGRPLRESRVVFEQVELGVLRPQP